MNELDVLLNAVPDAPLLSPCDLSAPRQRVLVGIAAYGEQGRRAFRPAVAERRRAKRLGPAVVQTWLSVDGTTDGAGDAAQR